ncbi:MAG: hypothetical protein E7184_01035 [Erysipelotrichaceae bacterium]|nr:hypothetical protein [Erysipelotrichaceae bacterium]
MKTRNFSYGFLFFRASSLFLLFSAVISFVIYSIKINPYTSISTNTFNITNDSNLVEISDESKVWSSENDIEIFSTKYSNSNGNFVESGNSDKVIAPGTSGSYTFNLKNSSDGTIEYSVKLNAMFLINNQEVKLENVPLKTRIKSSDEDYHLGSEVVWASIDELNEFLDSDKLNQNNHAYYTFDWKWDLEENDSFDTALGLLANTQDVDFKITISTEASLINTNDKGSNILVVALPIVGIVAPSVMVVLFVIKNRKKLKA